MHKHESDSVTVPSSKYMNFVDKPLKEHNKDQEQIVNNIHQEKYTSSNFPQLNSPSYPLHSKILTDGALTDNPQSVNQQTQVAMQSKPQLYTEKIKSPNEQLFSEKQVGTDIKNCDEAIQDTISVSKPNRIDPSFCKCTTLLQEFSQPRTVREHREEVQNKFLAQEEKRQAAVNTVQQCNNKIQNCMVESSIQESERIDTRAVKCSESDSRNVVGIRLKIANCSKSKFVLITIDGNHTPLMQVDCKKSIDKAEKDSGELKHDQKGQLNVPEYIALEISYLINSIRRNWYILKIYM